jgi:hypothetical protein
MSALWPNNKTIADVERDAFITGHSGVVDLIVRFEAELTDGTLSAVEATALEGRLETATNRADALEEAFGHVVFALRSAGYLRKVQASALADVLVEVVRDPEADIERRIECACGLRE